jgi:hypothetical protein
MHEFHFHHHIEPDSEVLARLDALSKKLDLIIKNQEKEMSLADDLNNGMTALATGFAAESVAVHAEIAALQAADPNLSPAVKQAIANISIITTSMAADAAALTASIPAATTVPPPAAPAAAAVAVAAAAPTVTPPDIATPTVTAPAATPPSTPPADATTTV